MVKACVTPPQRGITEAELLRFLVSLLTLALFCRNFDRKRKHCLADFGDVDGQPCAVPKELDILYSGASEALLDAVADLVLFIATWVLVKMADDIADSIAAQLRLGRNYWVLSFLIVGVNTVIVWCSQHRNALVTIHNIG